MPEGDTVWLHARQLQEALGGAELTRTDFRVPRYATSDLSGRRVLESASRGKHLLLRVEGDVTLHTHLRMDGTWRVVGAHETWRGGPAHQLRVRLVTSDKQALGYRLGVVELVRTSQEERVVGHLGPDLLGPDWDQAEAVRRLRTDPDRELGTALLDQRNLAGMRTGLGTEREGGPPPGEVEALRRLNALPGREIGDALLDQRCLAGIGNLYKAECLHIAGISPFTSVDQVPDLGRVVRIARDLMLANLGRWDQVTTGDPRPGRTRWVFERAGRPCRRCATPVRVAHQGDPLTARLTYWCPTCQRAPDRPPSS